MGGHPRRVRRRRHRATPRRCGARGEVVQRPSTCLLAVFANTTSFIHGGHLAVDGLAVDPNVWRRTSPTRARSRTGSVDPGAASMSTGSSPLAHGDDEVQAPKADEVRVPVAEPGGRERGQGHGLRLEAGSGAWRCSGGRHRVPSMSLAGGRLDGYRRALTTKLVLGGKKRRILDCDPFQWKGACARHGFWHRLGGKEVRPMRDHEKPSVLKSLTKEEFDALPDLSPEEVKAAIERGRESRRTAAAATPHPNVDVKARFR